MQPNQFRKIALSLPEAVEGKHMSHPDFRVGGKIFATLGFPDENWGVVKLTPDQQHDIVARDPDTFQAVKGGWGRGGATNVYLPRAKTAAVRKAMIAAWRNTAPKRLREGEDLSIGARAFKERRFPNRRLQQTALWRAPLLG
jgi:hypothetical protein